MLILKPKIEENKSERSVQVGQMSQKTTNYPVKEIINTNQTLMFALKLNTDLTLFSKSVKFTGVQPFC